MVYYCIEHYFNENDAHVRFDELIKTVPFRDYIENGNEDFKLYASYGDYQLGLIEGEDVVTLITDCDTELNGAFTCIEYEYADRYSIRAVDNRPNRFKVTFNGRDEEETKQRLLTLILHSNYSYLIHQFHHRSMEAYDAIFNIDKKIDEMYKWKVPIEITEEYLHDLESFMDECGKNYSKIQLNYNLARTHCKNIRINGLGFDDGPIYRKIDEIKLKLSNATVTYGRIKDMKDIALGKVEIGYQIASKRIQEDLLKRQKDAMTVQQASLVIEFIVVFYYTINIWKIMNSTGFEQASELLRYGTAISMAIGVILLFEVVKEFTLAKAIKNKYRFYMVFSLVCLAVGLVMINI